MIEDLKWNTLEMRRRRFRLTLMYKLTHGPIDIDSQKYFIQHSESHMRGSHQFTFNVPYANKDILNFRIFRELWLTGTTSLRPLYHQVH